MTACKKSKAKKLRRLQTAGDRKRSGTAARQKRRRLERAKTCNSCMSFVGSTGWCKYKKQHIADPLEVCEKHRLNRIVFKRRPEPGEVEASGRAARKAASKNRPKKRLTFWQRFFK